MLVDMSMVLDGYHRTAVAYVEKLQNAELKQVKDQYKEYYSKNKKIDAGAGVYAIYENENIMYVGRTDNIAKRLSDHYNVDDSATLANKLTNVKKEDPKYKQVLKQKRERVKEMQVRFVEIEDVNIQALTELLAYIELCPRYGNFKNH